MFYFLGANNKHKNPWRHAAVDPSTLEGNPYIRQADPVSADSGPGVYHLMHQAPIYGAGVHTLRIASMLDPNSTQPMFRRDNRAIVYRPLSFKENMQVMVDDYNRLENTDGTNRSMEARLSLFHSGYKDTCTAVVRKERSSKFKILPVSKNLVEISKDYTFEGLYIDYESINAPELDRNKGVYFENLTKAEVTEHPAWLAASEDDTNLLKEYSAIVFSSSQAKKCMSFDMRSRFPDLTISRALCLLGLNFRSCANIPSLQWNSSFIMTRSKE